MLRETRALFDRALSGVLRCAPVSILFVSIVIRGSPTKCLLDDEADDGKVGGGIADVVGIELQHDHHLVFLTPKVGSRQASR